MATFESVTCGRCGGSGQYSFNMMDGSRCYGCGGSGKKLTKRGAFISMALKNLRTIPYAQVQKGMIIDYMVVTLSGQVGNLIAYVEDVEQGVVSGTVNGIPNIATRIKIRAKGGYGEESLISDTITTTFKIGVSSVEARDRFIEEGMKLITKSGKVAKGKEQTWNDLLASLSVNYKPAIFASYDEWRGVRA